MATKSDIANLAIAAHNGEFVENIDGAPGRMAEAIQTMWALALEEALAAHPWKFARKSWPNPTAKQAADNPDPDRRFAFVMPPDCVRVFEIRPRDDFDEWPGCITTDQPSVTLIGVQRGGDIGRFSAYFCAYLGALLAYKICTPIEASEAIRKRCKDDVAEALANAKTDNGRAGVVKRVAPDSFVRSRLGGGFIPR